MKNLIKPAIVLLVVIGAMTALYLYAGKTTVTSTDVQSPASSTPSPNSQDDQYKNLTIPPSR